MSRKGPERVEERANALCRQWLESYKAPDLDEGVDEALQAFIRQKKDSMPDAFG